MRFRSTISQSIKYGLRIVGVWPGTPFPGLLLMLIFHMGCHIEILCDAMTKIASSKDEKHLRFVAVRHQELILFAERIEELFTFISLAQLMANTIVLCCLGYLVVIGVQNGSDFSELVKFAFCYVAICIEIFICCFAGEYLNGKNDMIVETAYKMSWYDLQPSTSRQVMLLLLRSQKGFQLTFGKFSALSLDTFTSIMKASASYMSVFLAMS
ncbi:odorant receptor 13a-like isoform X2 [Halictus rubicundus]|uniref:odorant receptor 13a-like isoform X2 n=1 Tax=Halictus rubicundus TaxID=77578 RepID=UPI00403509B1